MSQRKAKPITAQEIFDIDDAQYVEVAIPQWKGRHIRLKSLSAEDALAFVDVVENSKTAHQSLAKMVELSAVDENGARIFLSEGDMLKLRKKSLKVFVRIAYEAMKLNNMTVPEALSRMMTEELGGEAKRDGGPLPSDATDSSGLGSHGAQLAEQAEREEALIGSAKNA
jgi:hypothetical protein